MRPQIQTRHLKASDADSQAMTVVLAPGVGGANRFPCRGDFRRTGDERLAYQPGTDSSGDISGNRGIIPPFFFGVT
jgi:hypothetical protein